MAEGDIHLAACVMTPTEMFTHDGHRLYYPIYYSLFAPPADFHFVYIDHIWWEYDEHSQKYSMTGDRTPTWDDAPQWAQNDSIEWRRMKGED